MKINEQAKGIKFMEQNSGYKLGATIILGYFNALFDCGERERQFVVSLLTAAPLSELFNCTL